jgi:hypothetical protein
MNTPSVGRAALALRWTILRRRYVSPLEVVVLLAVSGLCFAVGKEGARIVPPPWVDAGLSVAISVWVAAQLGVARRLLYGARELALLVPSGLPPRTLVRLRLLELVALNAVACVPAMAFVVGARVGAARAVSPALALAPLAFAPACGALALLGGWLDRAARLVLLPALALCGLSFALAPARFVAVAAHPLLPGGALTGLADGRAAGAGLWLGVSLAAVLLALSLVARGFARGLDRAGKRPVGRHRAIEPALRALLAPLGAQAGALLRRDLLLVARGGFWRGVIICACMPLALAVVPVLGGESATSPFQLQLASLLVCGVISAGAGFLFGVDFPRARRDALLLERTQPVRARAVLLSRWVPAALYGVLVAGACALLVANLDVLHGEAFTHTRLLRQAGPVLFSGSLLALIATHHAVTYGLRSESQLDPTEAAAYPLNGGVVVVLFAFALALRPWTALAYPLLWFTFTRRALRRWETAEVDAPHQAAA